VGWGVVGESLTKFSEEIFFNDFEAFRRLVYDENTV
jgi:hypothetical protein